MIQSTVYQSYAEAKKTEYQCIMHGCKKTSAISDYVHKLEEKFHVECYYHPDDKEIVYLETGDWNQILTEFGIVLIFTIIGGLFDIFVGLIFTLGFFMFLCYIAASFFDSCCQLKCKERFQEIVLPYKDNIGLHLKLSMNCLNGRQLNKEFVTAIENGDSCVVKRIFARRSEIINENVRRRSQVTHPLYIAAAKNNVRLVEFLLLNGAKTSGQLPEPKHNRTVLHVACETGNTDLIKLLIKHGCLGYTGTSVHHSVILIMLEKGYTDCLKLLILAGYPIHKEAFMISSYLSDNTDNSGYSYMIDHLENPLSLQELCRISVRSSVMDYRLQERLEMLGFSKGGCLPEIMVRYLMLETSDSENGFSLDKDTADSFV